MLASAAQPDFADPFPSRLTVDDFGFEEVTLAELGARPAIGVVFACREPRR